MTLAPVRHETHQTNGISMHVARRGDGPLVLLCHGFPESWYSWRHQLTALADAGYCAVAPDMRGYGETDAPAASDAYTLFHGVGDLVGLLDALGRESAIVVGHDWGAALAWHAALLRPDRFRAVVGLSVPYSHRTSAPPTALLRKLAGENFSYMLYFQTPGVAEAELDADPRATLLRLFAASSGSDRRFRAIMSKRSRVFEDVPVPAGPAPWLTGEDLAVYVAQFSRTGFRGGLNWYRAMDRTWELSAPWHGAPITVPALFMVGEHDLVLEARRPAVDALAKNVPRLHARMIVPDCGHWIQQEKPAEVNAQLLAFLGTLL